jgi:3'-5' exoribonuclease
MWQELMQLTATIEPEELRQLTNNLLEKNKESFCEHPAAVSNHHAYLGGLIEHTLEVAQGVSEFAIRNPSLGLHHGLATSGAILHDIGKIIELETPIAATYGFEGQLIGHLLLGRDMVRDEAKTLAWSDSRLPGLLEHILISHHGELEYAAAMVPKTPEAIAVYHFDNLSAKLNMVRMHIQTDSEEGDFTDWERNFGRRFFKGLTD